MIYIWSYETRNLCGFDEKNRISNYENIIDLIKKGKEFKIFEVKTKKDITKKVLFKIIAKQKNLNLDFVSEDLLKKILGGV